MQIATFAEKHVQIILSRSEAYGPTIWKTVKMSKKSIKGSLDAFLSCRCPSKDAFHPFQAAIQKTYEWKLPTGPRTGEVAS
jgi:hypothetical protein